MLALLLDGSAAALGAAAGALLVVVFFTFGAFSVNLVATVAPRASMLFALMTYTLQVLLLAVVLVAVGRSDLAPDTLDPRWLGGTVMVGTLVWMAALLVGSRCDPIWGRTRGRTGSVRPLTPSEVAR